jgi:Family of unknown function (DUF6627)
MSKAFYTKPLILYLVVSLLAISTFTQSAEAMFLPSAPHQNNFSAAPLTAGRAEDLVRIRTGLESKVVRQKLLDYGLSSEEAMARLNNMSDEQISQLATHMESLQAGGDGGEFIGGLLVVALLVVVLVFLLNHRVEIR